VTLFGLNSAFAQNLGALSDEAKPQKLISATEIADYLKTPTPTTQVERNHINPRNQNNLCGLGCGGLGWDSLGLGWGGFYPSYYPSYTVPYYDPFFSSYYSPYYYPSYYGSYGSYYTPSYGSYYSPSYGSYYTPSYDSSYYPSNYYGLNEDNGNGNRAQANTNDQKPMDREHVPLVCFAADSSGTWFSNIDFASNVLKNQQAASNECSTSGVNCQSLGCAFATR